jgi:hypothetical protein
MAICQFLSKYSIINHLNILLILPPLFQLIKYYDLLNQRIKVAFIFRNLIIMLIIKNFIIYSLFE